MGIAYGKTRKKKARDFAKIALSREPTSIEELKVTPTPQYDVYDPRVFTTVELVLEVTETVNTTTFNVVETLTEPKILDSFDITFAQSGDAPDMSKFIFGLIVFPTSTASEPLALARWDTQVESTVALTDRRKASLSKNDLRIKLDIGNSVQLYRNRNVNGVDYIITVTLNFRRVG